LFYGVLIGMRRLLYIFLRTIQWNPAGTLRIVIYFPVVIAGLSAWTTGFLKRNKKAGGT
jgi:hypothetical protein